MREALLGAFFIALCGLATGGLILLLSDQSWLVLPATVLGSASMAGLCLHRQRRLLQTELARERQQHQSTRDFIQRILDAVPIPIYLKDAQSRYLIINTAQAEHWGKPRDSLIGTCSIDRAPNAHVATTMRTEDAAVLSGERIYKEEEQRHASSGELLSRIITKGRCVSPDGSYVIVCSLFDTTRWRQTERALQEAVQRQTQLRERTQDFVQRLIDVIPDPLYIKNKEGAFLLVNEAFAHERGRSKAELIGKIAHQLAFNPALAKGTPEEDLEVLAGAEIDKEQYFIHPSGEERFRKVIKRRCTDSDGKPVIVVAHFNITRWKVAERELARIANEDMLTGLPNRRRFTDDAARLMSYAERHHEALSLILFDLDYFKNINDLHGHTVGDAVLRELAQRMRQLLRAEDVPCRWGGEEFATLLPASSAAEALKLAERLRTHLAEHPFKIENLNIPVTLSCGVAQWQSGQSLDQLVACADKALYAAKNAGRNNSMLASSAA
jgi:diguanylate cyclase (GGDEF)-like protein/PAS domain S-box-containing protein